MSQQPNTVLNGPSSEIKVPLKDVQATQDMTKSQPNGTGTLPQPSPTITNYPRAPLTRLDSRSSIQVRPGYPNQPGAPLRPQQIRQPLPPGYQFAPRPQGPSGAGPPSGHPGPPGAPNQARPPQSPGQYIQNQGPRPNNINFRPPTPFPRPPPIQGSRPPGIFHQRSVPAFGQRLPYDSDNIVRSQTVDSPEVLTRQQDDVKSSLIDTRQINTKLPNMNSNIVETQQENERRRSISSTGSFDGGRSRSGSTENLNKNEDYPSRPESRASSRMNRIIEDDGDIKTVQPSKTIEQKVTENETKPKSPNLTNKIDEINNANKITIDDNKPKSINFDVKNLDLKTISKEGDNDSGVDESMQGNDQSSNGDHSSPRKSSGKIPSRTSSVTPTRNKSVSRESKSPSLRSPDSTATTPGATEKKKLPMNKIQVGSAPSPNLKVVKSKIGSLENASYKPGGGKVKIESKKLDFKHAAPKIEAKNDKYTPKGGEKKIQQQKLQWNAKSKIGSLENANHKPKGGDKKIESIKLDFKEKAKPKVGSKDNIKHVPGGGDVKSDEEDNKEEIENKKLDLKVQSKVGSLDNVKYKPGGGDKKIFDDKEYLKQRSSAISSENQSLSGSQAIERPSTARVQRRNSGDEVPLRKTAKLRRTKSARVKLTERAPWRF